jgi:hypothetical protein
MSFSFNFSILPLRKNFKVFFCFFIFAIPFLTLSFSEEKVQYLKKVGEIKDGFSSERENFFIKITGLCCDDEGNLYVADSGWNKIFKFDSNGKFLMSFGREGQGPGEFMGGKYINPLSISFGNDGKVYIKDRGNNRLSVFTKDGKFIKSYPLPPLSFYDPPVVDSKGNIFLHSQSGIKAIDCYDSNLKYKYSLLDIITCRETPFDKEIVPKSGPILTNEILTLITKNDEVIIVPNVSNTVYIFKDEKQIRKFYINEKGFLENIRKEIEERKRRKSEDLKLLKGLEKRVSPSSRGTGIKFRTSSVFFIFSSVFLGKEDFIYFVYISERKSKILKYDLTGKFLNKFESPEFLRFVAANKENIFGAQGQKIIIFKLF